MVELGDHADLQIMFFHFIDLSGDIHLYLENALVHNRLALMYREQKELKE